MIHFLGNKFSDTGSKLKITLKTNTYNTSRYSIKIFTLSTILHFLFLL